MVEGDVVPGVVGVVSGMVPGAVVPVLGEAVWGFGAAVLGVGAAVDPLGVAVASGVVPAVLPGLIVPGLVVPGVMVPVPLPGVVAEPGAAVEGEEPDWPAVCPDMEPAVPPLPLVCAISQLPANIRTQNKVSFIFMILCLREMLFNSFLWHSSPRLTVGGIRQRL